MSGTSTEQPERDLIDMLAWDVLDSLRQMDREACTFRNGHPTGLNWYGGHALPHHRRPATEPQWSKRIAQLLNERNGWSARAEAPFPADRRKRCDIVVRGGSGFEAWVEIKGAWRAWWGRNDHLFRSYMLHPLVEGLVPKSHTCALDLQKLNTLVPRTATHHGLLLVGFDSDEFPMSQYIEQFERLAGIGSHPWRTYQLHWSDVLRPLQYVRCWFWVRQSHALAVEPER